MHQFSKFCLRKVTPLCLAASVLNSKPGDMCTINGAGDDNFYWTYWNFCDDVGIFSGNFGFPNWRRPTEKPFKSRISSHIHSLSFVKQHVYEWTTCYSKVRISWQRGQMVHIYMRYHYETLGFKDVDYKLCPIPMLHYVVLWCKVLLCCNMLYCVVSYCIMLKYAASYCIML